MSGIVLLDTSAAVALCLADHIANGDVIAAVGKRKPGLAGHAWFETYSVLTRLPPPQRRSSAEILILLRENLADSVFVSDVEHRAFIEEISGLSIAGGAIYDGLVALAARSARLPLLSRDRRAAGTYSQLGIDVEFVH